MIVYLSLAVVIGLLAASALAFQLLAARSEHRRLSANVYTLDVSQGWPRETGPEEQGTEAVIRDRFVHGEINETTYLRQLHDLHDQSAA